MPDALNRSRSGLLLPPAPSPGARVALVAAAGPLPAGAIERAIGRVTGFGWEPKLGPHASERQGFLAGSDAHRLGDLNAALRSDENEMIWMLRGGYGAMRIVSEADWGALARRPRPLVGFSDNTVLQVAALQHGVVSFHGPHPAAPDTTDFSFQQLLRTLSGGTGILPLPTDAPAPVPVVPGVAEGPLKGGNLSLLAATAGTPYQLDATGAILFLEEVGEPAYRLDRLLTQLLLAGVFRGVAGIAVGGITECADAANPLMPEPLEVIRDRLAPLGVPLAYGLPFGHISSMWTLPIGVYARLDAGTATLEILEPAVTG